MSTKKNDQQSYQQSQSNGMASYLSQEYERWHSFFEAQPALLQRYFDSQARSLANAVLQPASQARFSLPNRVFTFHGETKEAVVPPDQREHLVGGFMDHLTRTGIGTALRQLLDELEASSSSAVATAAGLLRYATASFLVHDMLPSGRSVRYQALEGEEVPTIPIKDQQAGSAITALSDAIAEEGYEDGGEERGELLVPYVPAARLFFLPQWVAFDEQDRLLLSSVAEAEAYLASMQRYIHTLHTGVSLATYMVADTTYQQKRYGMLGQLINQGRALARFETREIIDTILRRSKANDLNRGLSLNLPYFDDQDLEMKTHYFDIIPAGRIMFLPTFVVIASRKEMAKVEQDTRLSRSTRQHLLAELDMLSVAFELTKKQ